MPHQRILLIEDDAAIRQGVGDALRYTGYRTLEAGNVPDGHRAELSEKEMELLRYLATNPDRAITREELLSCVWRIDPRGAETRTIDMHVARLREKLRDDPTDPRIILTVRGKGYSFAKVSHP
jgi:DNA-binding response OmpR family regulator